MIVMTDINQLGKVQPLTGTVNAELDRISALAVNATRGPWHGTRVEDGMTLPSGEYASADVFDSTGAYLISEVHSDDAAFIADARTTVPRLVDALRAVLELHHLANWMPACAECSDEWPCTTTKAITAGLFGEAK